MEASGIELDEGNTEVVAGKKTRKRKLGKKSDVRRVRGMTKPRQPAAPDVRYELVLISDVEFDSSPYCTKVVTTIRVLTLEMLPEPYKTYNMFPIAMRLEILKAFLQRYSWGEGEDVQRCIDVFENIASDAFVREMTEVRSSYTKKYGGDKEVWKDFPLQWCSNAHYWKVVSNLVQEEMGSVVNHQPE